MRIGDVIVLPSHAFTQVPVGDDWDLPGSEPGKRCVGHGFFGRWKHGGRRDWPQVGRGVGYDALAFHEARRNGLPSVLSNLGWHM